MFGDGTPVMYGKRKAVVVSAYESHGEHLCIIKYRWGGMDIHNTVAASALSPLPMQLTLA